jgi:hypothetical protein
VVLDEAFTVSDPTFAVSVTLANHTYADYSAIHNIVPLSLHGYTLSPLLSASLSLEKNATRFLDDREVSNTQELLLKKLTSSKLRTDINYEQPRHDPTTQMLDRPDSSLAERCDSTITLRTRTSTRIR